MDPSWHTFAVQSDGREEMVDIVDSGDRVIDTVARAVMRRDVLRHRAVFVLVRDGEGCVLIHRRSDAKDLWPGWWDIAVGGVVAAGESYDEAARRELFEEAGIAAEPVLVSSGAYDDTDVSLIARCYEVRHDGAVEARDGEVAEFRWVTTAELRDLVSRERFLPDSLALLGSRLFGG
jgi:8-oxo-dGTP pyrophosphatase MutT (NUDIX family)